MNSPYEKIKDLKNLKRYDEAAQLALRLIEETEQESNGGVLPAPYAELAKIYSKKKESLNELKTLERYFSQTLARGRSKEKLAERYLKLAEKTSYTIPDKIKVVVDKSLSGKMDDEILQRTLNQ